MSGSQIHNWPSYIAQAFKDARLQKPPDGFMIQRKLNQIKDRELAVKLGMAAESFTAANEIDRYCGAALLLFCSVINTFKQAVAEEACRVCKHQKKNPSDGKFIKGVILSALEATKECISLPEEYSPEKIADRIYMASNETRHGAVLDKFTSHVFLETDKGLVKLTKEEMESVDRGEQLQVGSPITQIIPMYESEFRILLPYAKLAAAYIIVQKFAEWT